MKDLRVVARVYNNQLRERREELGLTAVALADLIGIQATTYCALESMKISPTTSGMGPFGKQVEPRWRSSAIKVAEFHKVTPEILFPESVREMKKVVAEIRVDAEEVAAMLAPPADVTPLQLLSSAEDAHAVQAAVAEVLSPREQEVVSLRFGLADGRERTYAEIGERMEVGGERVRQIEAKALRKLRGPKGLALRETVQS